MISSFLFDSKFCGSKVWGFHLSCIRVSLRFRKLCKSKDGVTGITKCLDVLK